MNRINMTIDFAPGRCPREACCDLRVCTCTHSAAYSLFALLLMMCILKCFWKHWQLCWCMQDVLTLTYEIVIFSSSWAHWAGLQQTSSAAKPSALYSVGDSTLAVGFSQQWFWRSHNHKLSCWSYLSLLQSQEDSLHYNIACIISLSPCICIHMGYLAAEGTGGQSEELLESWIEWTSRCTCRPQSSKFWNALGGNYPLNLEAVNKWTDRSWDKLEGDDHVDMKAVIERGWWCTWRLGFGECRDALGRHRNGVWRGPSRLWWCELGGCNWVNLEVRRHTWRPWSCELGGHHQARFDMHLEAIIIWNWRLWSNDLRDILIHLVAIILSTWRLWSSEFGESHGDQDWVNTVMKFVAMIEWVWISTWRVWLCGVGGHDWVILEIRCSTSKPWSCELGGHDQATLEMYLGGCIRLNSVINLGAAIEKNWKSTWRWIMLIQM